MKDHKMIDIKKIKMTQTFLIRCNRAKDVERSKVNFNLSEQEWRLTTYLLLKMSLKTIGNNPLKCCNLILEMSYSLLRAMILTKIEELRKKISEMSIHLTKLTNLCQRCPVSLVFLHMIQLKRNWFKWGINFLECLRLIRLQTLKPN